MTDPTPTPEAPSAGALSGRATLGVGLLALVTRVGAALQHASEGMFLSDETSYFGLAKTLADTGRYAPSPEAYPEIFRGPTYTAFLAALMTLVGTDLRALLLLQSLCGVGTVVLLMHQLDRSLRQAGLPPAQCARAALLAGVLLAISPFLILRERFLMSEGLCTFTLALAQVTWMRAREDGPTRQRLAWALGSGVAFGITVLGKPATMLLPGLVLAVELWSVWRLPQRVQAFSRAVLPFALSLLVVAPWTARNYAVTHRFIPVGIGGGIYLWLGTRAMSSTNTIPESEIPAEILATHKRLLAPTTPVEERIKIDAEFTAMGKAAIAAAPAPYIKYSLIRGFRLWVASHIDTLKTEPASLRPFGLLWALVNLGLAALSPLLSPRSSYRHLYPFAVIPLYFTIVHMPISSGARYSILAWPQVLCLSAVAAAALVERLRARAATAPAT